MAVLLLDEVLGLPKRSERSVAARHDDGVPHHGGGRLHRHLDVDRVAARRLHAAEARADEARRGALGRQRGMSRAQRRAVDAVGHQQRYLHAAHAAIAGARGQ